MISTDAYSQIDHDLVIMEEQRQPTQTYYDSSLLQQDDGTLHDDPGASQSDGSNDSEGPSSSKKRKRPMNVTFVWP